MDQSLHETASQVTGTLNTKPKPTVLVPLYIYPLDDETWKPLYEAYVWSDSTPSLVPEIWISISILTSSYHQI
jgi:hypothetical protein